MVSNSIQYVFCCCCCCSCSLDKFTLQFDRSYVKRLSRFSPFGSSSPLDYVCWYVLFTLENVLCLKLTVFFFFFAGVVAVMILRNTHVGRQNCSFGPEYTSWHRIIFRPRKEYATSIPRNAMLCDVMLSSVVCVCVCGTMFSRFFFQILSDLIQQSGWVRPVDSLAIALGVRDVQ